MVSYRTDVLIVGAGPVGLTLGIELLTRDVPVRLIDRANRPNPHAKAIILWPRALEALGRIGVAEEILRRGHVIRAQNYHSGKRRLAHTDFGKLSGTRYPFALSLPQEQTEEVLRRRFSELGGNIEFGTNFQDLRQDADGLRAELSTSAGASFVSCRWLVGCDGAHSAVRDALGIAFAGASYPQQFLLADGECDTALAHDEAHYFMTQSGVLVVVGLPDGLYRAFVSVAPDSPADDPADVVQQAASARCPVPINLKGQPRTGVFRVYRRMAERFRQGSVLLAGDAAHVHSPAGGQGLNTGIEDASSLAWRLAGVTRGTCPASELDEWERERRHVARGVVEDTDRQTRLWMLRGWRRPVRDLVLRAAEVTGLLDRVIVPRQAQLTLTYPGSRQRAGLLVTGARLPDIKMPGGGWLHDLMRPPRAHLLLFADRSARADALDARWSQVADLDVIRVESRRVRAALHAAAPVAALVRPDAVVDWAGKLRDTRLDAKLAQRPSGRPG